MIEIIWKPELHSFNSCQEFADEFRLCETDLILTNEYINQPYFGSMNLGCRVLYQEKYGIGEPTDTMTEAIMQDMKKTGCKRVIAIGGGTVIDIAKVLAGRRREHRLPLRYGSGAAKAPYLNHCAHHLWNRQ